MSAYFDEYIKNVVVDVPIRRVKYLGNPNLNVSFYNV